MKGILPAYLKRKQLWRPESTPVVQIRQSGDVECTPNPGKPNGSRGGMTGLDPMVSTIENYRRFARDEAAGRSPSYERLAYAVAGDDVILPFLANLPPAKRQPNLLFAAARFLLGGPPE